jgi:dihydropyrimidinase
MTMPRGETPLLARTATVERAINEGYETVVVGGTVVTGPGRYRADVGITGGQIVAIAANLAGRGRRELDARGCYVLPGVIDAHVHPIHAETMATVSEAAAFGGVTTLLHHIYIEPDRGIEDTLRGAIDEGESTSLLDFGLHARLTQVPHRLKEIPAAAALGVRTFKLFMAYGARGIMSTDGELLDAMERIRDVDGLALVHAENGAVIDRLEARAQSEGRNTPADYVTTRPPQAEAEAVHRAAVFARLTDVPLYIVHLSSALALAEVRAAKATGQRIHAETCPHYLTLVADEAMPRLGVRAKIAPPLRARSDIDALWRGLSDRVLDVVGSDHSAFALAEKEFPGMTFLEAGFGAPGIEEMLSVVHDAGVTTGRLTLERMVEVLSEVPARIFGLSTKGRVAVGADADLVVFDPATTRVPVDGQHHGRAYYSLYSDRRLIGAPRMVLQRGQVIVDGGHLAHGPARARFLATDPARSS